MLPTTFLYFVHIFFLFFFWFFFWNRRLILARNGIGNHHLMCGWCMISRQNSSTLSHFLCSFFFFILAFPSRSARLPFHQWKLYYCSVGAPGSRPGSGPAPRRMYPLLTIWMKIRPDTRYYFKWQGAENETKKKKMKRKERKGQDRRHSLGCRKRIITRLIDGIEFNSSR